MTLILKAIQFAKCSLVFILNSSGKEYGVFFFTKICILFKLISSLLRVKRLSGPVQQLLMIDEILRLPKALKGDVVECGCYNGASAISLSLACALTKRRLFVCDSFRGLPAPRDDEQYDVYDIKGNLDDTASFYHWAEGEFASEGGLEGVQKVIAKYGNISVCEFVKGFYCDTLKTLNTASIVMVFEDADLASSVEDCLLYLWPKLQETCKFYCHEPWSIHVVALFYDKKWWRDHFQTDPPGFYGSGKGIMRSGYYADIGYAKKVDSQRIIANGERIVHSGSKGCD